MFIEYCCNKCSNKRILKLQAEFISLDELIPLTCRFCSIGSMIPSKVLLKKPEEDDKLTEPFRSKMKPLNS